jgi:type IV pilus assembly protein PilV
LQAKMVLVHRDAMQRSQALWLLEDMISRIQVNRAETSSYVTDSAALGVGTAATFATGCADLTGYQLDQCQWSQLLQGAAEISSSTKLGAMEGARGCIYSLGTAPAALRVVITWQGSVATADPLPPEAFASTGADCGSGAYGDNTYRRALFADVIVPTL